MGEVACFKSLDAVTSVGPGAVVDCQSNVTEVAMYVATTGSPTSCSVTLDVSIDGVIWSRVNGFEYDVGGSQTVAGGIPLARYLRAELAALAGGSAPTVTALLTAR